MKSSNRKLLLVAAIFFIASPLTMAQQEMPEEGVPVRKFSDSVYAIFAGGTSVVVIGDTGVLVTDPADRPHARLLKKLIAKITDKPVTQVVLSHEHSDHVGGAEEFEGAEIIAQESARSVFRLDPLNQLPKRIDVTFQNEYVVNMGRTPVHLKYFGPAEGIANIVVYLPQERLVLLTDLYEADKEKTLTEGDILDATNMVGMREIFHAVSKWKPKYALTAHSSSTDPRVMYEHAAFIDALYDAVFPRLQKVAGDGNKLWELVQALPNEISLPAYKDWKNYEDLPRYVYRMAYAIAYGG